MFHRLSTDRTRTPVPLRNHYAGPIPAACWLIGGGPSLTHLPTAQIAASPVPKMAINLAGARLIRPDFWTSYDPTARFHRSIYLDPGITKFVHHRRAMDLIPETTFKVCDSPNLCFFDRDGDRGFHNFVAPDNTAVVDWADSMVQAIDILYQLGFRIIYLAGCELRIRPSKAQIHHARRAGVKYHPHSLLSDFVKNCREAGLSHQELDRLEPAHQYHFGEHKPIRAAANTDQHYFRIVQYLRLSRRALALAGLQLISVTPHSRLNDHFPYLPARTAIRHIHRSIGNPDDEPLQGLYTSTNPRHRPTRHPMRDYRPHHWPPPTPTTPPPPPEEPIHIPTPTPNTVQILHQLHHDQTHPPTPNESP